MDATPTSADEPTPDEEAAAQETGRSLRVLARAMLLSVLVHLSPLLLTLYVHPTFDPIDLNTEWFGEFEDLQAVGHGNLERQVQFSPPPPEQPEEEEPPQEVPPEEKEDPPEEAPPEEEPETEPEPAPPKKDEEEPPKLAALDPKTPKPKPPEKQKAPEKTDPVESKKHEAPEEKPAREPLKKEEPAPSRSAESLPGLEYSGPSNLPMLKNYAPGNARMTALIRLDVLRDTPYHEPTRKLLAAVPDYRIILDGSSTDPVRDFDTIFTASANPMYLQETFLVVKHSLGKKKLKAQLDARFEQAPPWGTYKGVQTRPIVPESSTYQDPRKVLISDDSTALVARPEWLGTLTDDQAGDASIRPGFEGDQPPKFTMLQSFEHIANAAPGDTMMLASFQGLRFMLPGVGTLPRTETLRVSITTPDNPRVTVDLQFKTAAQATSFARDCPEMQREIIGSIPGARLMKIDAYVNRLSCKADDTYVTVTGTYTQKEFLRAINLATPFLPKPPSLEDLPRPPEQKPEPISATPDMGTPPALDMPADADMVAGQPGDLGSPPASREASADMQAGVTDGGTPGDAPPPLTPRKEVLPSPSAPDMSSDAVGD